MFNPTSSLAAVICLAATSFNYHRLFSDAFVPHGISRASTNIPSGPHPRVESSSFRARGGVTTTTTTTTTNASVVAVSSRWPSSRLHDATRRRRGTGGRGMDGPRRMTSGATCSYEGGAMGGGRRREEEHPDTSRSCHFDPLGLGVDRGWDDHRRRHRYRADATTSSAPRRRSGGTTVTSAASSVALASLSVIVVDRPAPCLAAIISEGDFNPDTFRPVCAASDSFYRILQSSTRALVGDDNFSEYGPLIAGGLLRIRLELCVVESFFNEAVGPFIQQNGLSWILPLHETVETFLAGSIFALATTFILVGSTKLIQIIAFYGDLLLGGPCRLFGGFFFDRARGMPVTLDVSFFGFWKTRLVGPPLDSDEGSRNNEGGTMPLVDFDKVRPADVPLLALSGAIKVVGEASKVFREFIEGLDLFVGRYLVLIASGYIIVKVIHFKVFPDFP